MTKLPRKLKKKLKNLVLDKHGTTLKRNQNQPTLRELGWRTDEVRIDQFSPALNPANYKRYEIKLNGKVVYSMRLTSK